MPAMCSAEKIQNKELATEKADWSCPHVTKYKFSGTDTEQCTTLERRSCNKTKQSFTVKVENIWILMSDLWSFT